MFFLLLCIAIKRDEMKGMNTRVTQLRVWKTRGKEKPSFPRPLDTKAENI